MKGRGWVGAVVLACALMLGGCGSQATPTTGETAGATAEGAKKQEQVELVVSAAISLTDSLKEVEAEYARTNPNVKLTFNFGASGTLQQQIEQGAPADLFLSAGKKQMTALVDKQLIDPEQHTNLLTNELVVVVSADQSSALQSVADLEKPEVKKLAAGQPEAVPAGSYAKESLTYHKLWDVLQPKLVFAKDVRQVLSYVETGNAEAGYVYRTDALTSKKVKIAFAADPGSYKLIEYPAGVVKASKHPEEAKKLYQYLQTKPAQDIFEKYGFRIPGN